MPSAISIFCSKLVGPCPNLQCGMVKETHKFLFSQCLTRIFIGLFLLDCFSCTK